MSGGRFNHADSQLKSEIFGGGDKPCNVFEDREISELVWDVLDLIHEFDYYKSGDSDRNDYCEAKRKFKAKWLKPDTDRCKRIVDAALNDCRSELYDTFDISNGGE